MATFSSSVATSDINLWIGNSRSGGNNRSARPMRRSLSLSPSTPGGQRRKGTRAMPRSPAAVPAGLFSEPSPSLLQSQQGGGGVFTFGPQASASGNSSPTTPIFGAAPPAFAIGTNPRASPAAQAPSQASPAAPTFGANAGDRPSPQIAASSRPQAFTFGSSSLASPATKTTDSTSPLPAFSFGSGAVASTTVLTSTSSTPRAPVFGANQAESAAAQIQPSRAHELGASPTTFPTTLLTTTSAAKSPLATWPAPTAFGSSSAAQGCTTIRPVVPVFGSTSDSTQTATVTNPSAPVFGRTADASSDGESATRPTCAPVDVVEDSSTTPPTVLTTGSSPDPSPDTQVTAATGAPATTTEPHARAYPTTTASQPTPSIHITRSIGTSTTETIQDTNLPSESTESALLAGDISNTASPSSNSPLPGTTISTDAATAAVSNETGPSFDSNSFVSTPAPPQRQTGGSEAVSTNAIDRGTRPYIHPTGGSEQSSRTNATEPSTRTNVSGDTAGTESIESARLCAVHNEASSSARVGFATTVEGSASDGQNSNTTGQAPLASSTSNAPDVTRSRTGLEGRPPTTSGSAVSTEPETNHAATSTTTAAVSDVAPDSIIASMSRFSLGSSAALTTPTFNTHTTARSPWTSPSFGPGAPTMLPSPNPSNFHSRNATSYRIHAQPIVIQEDARKPAAIQASEKQRTNGDSRKKPPRIAPPPDVHRNSEQPKPAALASSWVRAAASPKNAATLGASHGTKPVTTLGAPTIATTTAEVKNDDAPSRCYKTPNENPPPSAPSLLDQPTDPSKADFEEELKTWVEDATWKVAQHKAQVRLWKHREQDCAEAYTTVLKRQIEEANRSSTESIETTYTSTKAWAQATKYMIDEAKQFLADKGRRTLGNPPNEFCCPITLEVMSNPVVASDGSTYEQAAIRDHFRFSGNHRRNTATSPLTNKTITMDLIPNYSLRSMIQRWKVENSITSARVD